MFLSHQVCGNLLQQPRETKTYVLGQEKKKSVATTQIILALGFKGGKEQDLIIVSPGPGKRADVLGPKELVCGWSTPSVIPNTRYQIPGKVSARYQVKN